MANGDTFDRDEALFLSIMYSFHAAAMQQMGKIANPFTGKIERDLDAARGTIDVLLMFRKKTEGNLTDRERRVLTNLITELQLNFVDERKREPAAAKEAAPAASEAPAPPGPSGEGGEEAAAAETSAAEADSAVGERPEEKAAPKPPGAKKKKGS